MSRGRHAQGSADRPRLPKRLDAAYERAACRLRKELLRWAGLTGATALLLLALAQCKELLLLMAG